MVKIVINPQLLPRPKVVDSSDLTFDITLKHEIWPKL